MFSVVVAVASEAPERCRSASEPIVRDVNRELADRVNPAMLCSWPMSGRTRRNPRPRRDSFCWTIHHPIEAPSVPIVESAVPRDAIAKLAMFTTPAIR